MQRRPEQLKIRLDEISKLYEISATSAGRTDVRI